MKSVHSWKYVESIVQFYRSFASERIYINMKIKSNIAMEFKEFIDFSEKTVALKPMKYFTQFKFDLKIKEITGNV